MLGLSTRLRHNSCPIVSLARNFSFRVGQSAAKWPGNRNVEPAISAPSSWLRRAALKLYHAGSPGWKAGHFDDPGCENAGRTFSVVRRSLGIRCGTNGLDSPRSSGETGSECLPTCARCTQRGSLSQLA
jgi:hypothetical protein